MRIPGRVFKLIPDDVFKATHRNLPKRMLEERSRIRNDSMEDIFQASLDQSLKKAPGKFPGIPSRILKGNYGSTFESVCGRFLNKNLKMYLELLTSNFFIECVLKKFGIYGGISKETHGSFSRGVPKEMSSSEYYLN